MQGRLRRDGAIVELTVDKSSVVEYLLDSNEMSTEAEESSLLETIAREWLVKTQQAGKMPSSCCGDL
jgi:hypothetical protein